MFIGPPVSPTRPQVYGEDACGTEHVFIVINTHLLDMAGRNHGWLLVRVQVYCMAAKNNMHYDNTPPTSLYSALACGVNYQKGVRIIVMLMGCLDL